LIERREGSFLSDQSASRQGFTVEFPYGDFSSLCEARTEEAHPRYGNGLFILQSFPYQVRSETEGMRLAFQLNAQDLGAQPSGYGLGTYLWKDGMIQFVSFLPNIFFSPGLLPNLFFSCALRAHAMSKRLTGADWTPESFTPRNSALGKLMARME